MSSVYFALGLTFLIITTSQAQDIRVRSQVNHTPEYGPAILLSCFVSDYPVGLGTPNIQWLFKDVILSKNDKVVEGAQSRYLPRYSRYTSDNVTSATSQLYIYNALKADEGNYTCRLNVSSQTSIYLQVDSYLPPLDFPKCSIEPQLSVVAGTNITFTCEPGDSNPPVNLNLTLHRPDGSDSLLDAATTAIQVTAEDNGTMFTCQMTSDTFHRAPHRNCSAGPLIITQVASAPSSPTSSIFETTTKASQPTDKGNPSSSPTSSIFETTTKASQPTDKGNPSKSSSSCVNILIAPIAIAIISIMGNDFQLWKNHQLKKIIASQNEAAMDDKGVDGPYMELQKTSKPVSEEYMDLNRGTVSSDDQGRKYENIAERAHGNDGATNYEVVHTGLKN